ncbi:2'-5' RNA ligase family protein [Crocosphaera sp. XPORK-15E]|uniref:2'-5' RNA ligase family protein n=1 Tax=Crocosphaera sp. XPORK-15E TaxID=3110247 RepID=UPI002B1EAFF9|nr:2'-5' RNA ligase family protein [Crocosphaera sp. XPORK-15E]MEA5536584.1 2'-5' RNA ligase family protein [Crocosphaera sp. XPORK-15E]
MNSSKKRFFIALLPPQEVQLEAHKIKQYFSEVYNSHAALKSPPHVTLQPPFEWEIEALSLLIEALQNFSQSQLSIPMILDGFAAFKPRVIYINVLKNQELLLIQKNLMSHLESSLNIVNPISKNCPFSPHLTVGFRDLTKPNFYLAWSEFQDKKFYFEFIIDKLTLLLHNGKMWEIYQEFSLTL